jgi:hypothetical protein
MLTKSLCRGSAAGAIAEQKKLMAIDQQRAAKLLAEINKQG